MITARQVATHLGISASKVYSLFAAGVLHGYRMGRSIRFDINDINAYKEQCRSTGSPQKNDGASSSPTPIALKASGIDLASYFHRAGLKPKLTRTTGRKRQGSGELRLVQNDRTG